MIRIKNLSFTYKPDKTGWILKDACLDAAPGECILVCGASGCGKTTLTRAVNGLIPHFEKGWRAGRVLVNRAGAYRDVKHFRPHELARIMGSVFQDPRSQFFTTRVEDEVVWGCENLKFEKKKMTDRLAQALSLFNLEHLRDRNVFELSNGEKQRAVFASVWAMEPGIYVLDEPSSNLDPGSVQNLRWIIRRLKGKGHTVVIAEHRLYYLAGLIDRMVVMDRGKIKACYQGGEIQALSSSALETRGLRRMDPAHLEFNGGSGSAGAGGSGKVGRQDLVLNNLGFRHKGDANPVIRDVSFTISRGEILGICGPNGSGKTTLCRLVSGLIRKTTGEVCLGSTPLPAKERLKICHLVLQQADHQLFRASVRQEVLSMPRCAGKDRFAIEEILQCLGLLDLADCHPQALSGGQKQRLSIACALARAPDFLILDEPTSGMDAGHMNRLAGLLKAFAERGRAVVVVTHDAQFMAKTCARAVLLDQGRVRMNLDLSEPHKEFNDYLTQGILP